jgi:hypothetical protein
MAGNGRGDGQFANCSRIALPQQNAIGKNGVRQTDPSSEAAGID